MRSGTCPKCHSTAVYANLTNHDMEVALHADGPLHVNLHFDKGGIFGDSFTRLQLDVYLCQQCGYVEQYVHDRAALARLPETKNWRPVGGSRG